MKLAGSLLLLFTLGCGPGVTLSPSTAPDPDLPDIEDLIALFRFDTDANVLLEGESVTDSHIYALHGVAGNNGSGMRYIEGVFGNAIHFDGADDYIQNTNSAFDNLEDFSISVWLRPASTGKQESGRIVVKGWEVMRGWIFSMSSGPAVQIMRTGTSASNNLIVTTAANSVPLNEWTHVVLTTEEDLSASHTKFYINGSLVTPGFSQSGSDRDDDTGSTLLCGGRPDDKRNYDGDMDDLAIFERVITQEEVTLLYERGSSQIEFPEDFD